MNKKLFALMAALLMGHAAHAIPNSEAIVNGMKTVGRAYATAGATIGTGVCAAWMMDAYQRARAENPVQWFGLSRNAGSLFARGMHRLRHINFANPHVFSVFVAGCAAGYAVTQTNFSELLTQYKPK